MQLMSMSIAGFRSLEAVGPIPVRRPTILTGHNDSGKSATLDALAFLLGVYSVSDEDRTFESSTATINSEVESNTEHGEKRVGTTCVEGEFSVSEKEQADLGLPSRVKIRRISVVDGGVKLEVLSIVPENENLRELGTKSLSQLKEIAEDLGVVAASDARTKSSWLSALEEFAETQPKTEAWSVASNGIKYALPRFLRFGDAESAELVVKAALNSRYKVHLEDGDLKQQVHNLESELAKRVRDDAQGLIDHIKQRCSDLVLVDVEPVVSFTSGLRSTKLLLARTNGEAVSLSAVGAGRARRISLAIWEWTSDLLRKDAEDQTVAEELQHVVLAYDEPDTHLDYLQQRRVMKLIREQCAVPGVSMMIATHSMNLVDGAAIEDIVHLSLDRERTRMDALLSDLDDATNGQHLSDIAAALGLRNTVLLHERCFVGVEGVTEQQCFPLLFRLCTGRPIHSAGIVIVGCNNNEGALKFIGYLARSKRQVLLVVDADSQKLKIFSKANLAKEGLNISHVRPLGDPDKELEYLFTDTQWCSVANSVWPRTDSRSWVPSDIEAPRNGKFSTQLLELFKTNSENGPTSKASMMYEMARSLRSADEVPAELRNVFLELEKLAALDS
ncbi:TOPRIM nucleotidyl transferase/hydrolase domain-containing protein [Dactylosporangium sp. NPDC051484]|uniref:TOPRIM nucleotidyl transferase/hydrolase domain-containing protein n=1 Tax=Dactylosporangium sp. NPDC051484 TaxID=3154942 RepID=UPI00344FA61F